ncbi:FBP domain-containing protein [Streptomyces sp. AJS327]|uniref:FBP domain-containing protein n=1 Tax=Streptomyces sp. AJS327 TaxID=2545265 RepID=UPI0015DDF2DE|nr:FBP domain-containing protein [Streptomyces sp. AJS327]MBA0053239.1 FBP domain-containing protein [Streptomyces sp. AJS327]
MRPLSEPEIRAAFVNRTKGEAKRLPVPRDLAEQPWTDLDYLGWRDPQAPQRAYLVTEWDGRPTALALRSPAPTSWQTRRGMCSLCLTTHPGGVSLMVAPRAGKAGRQGDSVGVYLCGDLACSLYVRGLRNPGVGARLHETLTLEQKIERTTTNLATFLTKVTTTP